MNTDCGIKVIDKSEWGPGPWQDEPDKLEFVDKDTGYPCVIRRNTHFGTLCGYVAVPRGHILQELKIPTSCLPSYRVHGGLNWCGHSTPGFEEWAKSEGKEFVALTHSLVDDETLWLGFDAMHTYDVFPAVHDGQAFPRGGTYKDIEYMKDQCRRLARQIASDKFFDTYGDPI